MKKLLMALLIILCAKGMSWCVESLWRSSVTATNETGVLCGGGKRGALFRVVVSSAPLQGAPIVTVFNSSFTTLLSSAIAPIDARTPRDHEYRISTPKGLMYVTSGAPAVTFLYECY